MKGGRGIVTATLAILLLAGCGGGEKDATATRAPGPPRELHLTLDGRASPENVAVLMADSRRFFAQEGLRVLIASPALPRRPVSYVANRTDDFGLAPLPEVALGRDRGARVVAVGSLVSEPTAAMIWLKRSGISGIAGLKGKTIAVSGVRYQEGMLEDLLAQAGLTLEDVVVDKVAYDLVPALLSGRADAIFGGSWNVEGVELEARGERPVVTRVQDLGIPDYEEVVVVAHDSTLAEDPQLIRDFMAALMRGAAAAVEDPAAAVDVIEESVQTNPETSRAATAAEVEATLPLLSTSGEMDPERAQGTVDWMKETGMVQRQIPVAELLTNDYLESP